MPRNDTEIGLQHHCSINRIFWRRNTSLFTNQNSTQTIMTCILKALLYQMLCKDLKGFQTWRTMWKNSPFHDGRLSHQLLQTTRTIQLSSASHRNANPDEGHLSLSICCWILKKILNVIKDKRVVICYQLPNNRRVTFCQCWKWQVEHWNVSSRKSLNLVWN